MSLRTNPSPGSSAQSQPFRFPDQTGIYDLPVEIVQFIGASFLDAASSVTLALTCRNFKQIIHPLLPKFKFCKKAAELGYLCLVQWGIDQNCRWTSRASGAAAKNGHLDVLQWAWDQGCLGFAETAIRAAEGNQGEILEWIYVKGAVPLQKHADAAVRHGHVKLYQKLQLRLGEANELDNTDLIELVIKSKNLTACKDLLGKFNAEDLEDYGLTTAIDVGDLEIFKFLLSLGAEVDSQLIYRASMKGKLDILKFIFSEIEFNFDEKVADFAARDKQWHLVRWLIDQKLKGSMQSSVYAAQHNRLEELELMHQAKWPMSNEVCARAAAYGHWDLVKRLIGKGLFCEESLLYFCAAKQGRVDLLNEIRQKKVPIARSSENFWIFFPCKHGNYDIDAYRKYALAIGAAWSGNFETLNWVEEQGFEWQHELVPIAAVHGGNLEVLKWLFQKNCPYKSKELYQVAVFHEHIHIIEWMIEFLLETSDFNVSIVVAKSGKGDLLKKLVKQGCPVNVYTIQAAASAGHWDIVDWLKEKGCSWYEGLLMAAAAQGKEKILYSCFHQHINEADSPLQDFEIFDSRLMNILAQHGYWELFRDVITQCIYKGIPGVLESVKAQGYGFDIEAVTQAAYVRAERGDGSVISWLKKNNYLT
ncbi:MAG TPA: hypothetical protein VHK67_06315 [Rhabdochlamydiaceae bacterium]|jgi:hypothetical protein|nr:hypothetical protein [Rhabdochlamydiaceae bacterium]